MTASSSSGTRRSEAPRRALVVGLGVGGMSAALGLDRAGWDVTLVERSPERRAGGYFIGLSQEGFEAARYLGVDQALHTRTPEGGSTWEVDEHGRRTPSMNFSDQPNNPQVVLRGDIEEALWSGVEDRIPVRFGVVPQTIGTNPREAVVRLHDTVRDTTSDETFDLVVGADGVRSSVRRQVFGPNEEFMHPLGSIICAFQLSSQLPGTDPRDGLTIAENRRSLWIFPFSDRPPTALFTYRPDDVDAQFRMDRGDALRQAYAGMNGDGAVQFALDEFDRAENFLFDSVHRVRMPRWHHNRAVLLGDSAWCLTLYSGYGATSAMHGGALLGKHLTHFDDIDLALAQWEGEMRQYVEKVGRPTALKEQLFVPSNRAIFAIRSALLTKGGLNRAKAVVETHKRGRARAISTVFGERGH
jgi:2-polyprenyl-6-methoxyphenol hydroxylase-like FAD-dependent oxidoreductase